MNEIRKLVVKLGKQLEREGDAIGKALDTADELDDAEESNAPDKTIKSLEARLAKEKMRAQDFHSEAAQTAEELAEAVTENFADEYDRLAEF
jgi:uncharacterized coiled-coil DUF342 family protein